MNKEDLKRLKAGLMAGVVSLSLSGCIASDYGFNYNSNKENEVIADASVDLSNRCLQTSVVAEVYNQLTGEVEIMLAKKLKDEDEKVYYSDLLQPYRVMFYEDNELNNFLILNKTTPLVDFINALDLYKYEYSYDDMVEIYNRIKEVYPFEGKLELTK